MIGTFTNILAPLQDWVHRFWKHQKKGPAQARTEFREELNNILMK